MSKEGYDNLLKEIAHLESVERPRIVNAIAEARDKGDLSENAEYDSAKEAQGLLEAKISMLKATLLVYTIVSESEANLREGKISTGTPIAKALIGHKVGDIVPVQLPVGTVEFEIINIEL